MQNRLNYSLCFVLVCFLGLFQLRVSARGQLIQIRNPRFSSEKLFLGSSRDCKANPNDGEIESLGRFAVLEHNKIENALLEFRKVIDAKEQAVSGKMYHLTLEAIDGGRKRIYEAKVWVKPWLKNFKQLQDFKRSYEAPLPGIGIKQDRFVLGWQILPIHDPVVSRAATYAVQAITQMSNSLVPYELVDILLAKKKEIENYVKFYLILSVRNVVKKEKFKVMVRKTIEGKFYLDCMEQDHS
ncbi:unnamed protein product [Cuscuta epithymum]|uniref:Cysteine proteinase inhibitor n=1 Tax=Cuscuta epithymum TaxID=186058 RepID=A0AAV0FGM6_9ASTE|nr:unnamed protein product [Cuscuta epithymum]